MQARAIPRCRRIWAVTFPAGERMTLVIVLREGDSRIRSNVVLVAVSLDPHHAQEADVELPLWSWRTYRTMRRVGRWTTWWLAQVSPYGAANITGSG